MSANKTVPVGAISPQQLTFTVAADGSVVNLATATAYALDVRHDSGTETTWAATVSGTPSPTRLVLVHPFAVGDLPVAEQIRVVARVTLAGGTVITRWDTLTVTPKFG